MIGSPSPPTAIAARRLRLSTGRDLVTVDAVRAVEPPTLGYIELVEVVLQEHGKTVTGYDDSGILDEVPHRADALERAEKQLVRGWARRGSGVQ